MDSADEGSPNAFPASIKAWVNGIKKLTNPDQVYWCNGSEEENEQLLSELVETKNIIKLNESSYPGCYLYRTSINDVARVEDRTFICTDDEEEAGPTNNWMDKKKAFDLLNGLFSGVMKGRKMYVVPYLMGPVGSKFSQVGVEITDSAYVVVNMRILTRLGIVALDELRNKKEFIKGVHSTGSLSLKDRYICHFPDERLIMSINTAYGGNAMLSKKPHALRISSITARDEGWLAEHMFLLEVNDRKSGKKYYFSGALPSASGKTNLAMIKPPGGFSDFDAKTVGDDISWLFESNGEIRAINPENGFFGVAYGTSPRSNPRIIESLNKNTIFTNVAIDLDKNEPWWEGLSDPPKHLYDWEGRLWSGKGDAAQKNSRFNTPISQYPFKSDAYEDPAGVPLSAIIFGGRRSTLMPLVYQAKTFEQGILIGAMNRSETTSAQSKAVGVVRDDPMAMIAFCGYNIGDYFRHWFDFSKKIRSKPGVFSVNWFRKDENGSYIWPGFGENFRVIKWMIDRTESNAGAIETPIGFIPKIDDLDLSGLDVKRKDIEKLLEFDKAGWQKELKEVRAFFRKLGDRMPEELMLEFQKMKDAVDSY